jgi:hypothetical protein
MLKALLSPQRSETNTGRVVEVDLEALAGQEKSSRRSTEDCHVVCCHPLLLPAGYLCRALRGTWGGYRLGAGLRRLRQQLKPCGLLRARERRPVEATCATWPNVALDLGGSRTAGDRCCPLRSGRSWPGCGPDVAPAVPSLEGASRQSAQPGSYADATGQVGVRPTAVDREGPPDTDATGTRRARPARMKPAPAWQRWSQAQPEGEGRPR